ncbi:hypothetical protein XA3_06200 [Xylocopilactobacillus apicola]|uniref:BspA family leucine-rich repeat surface protein n=2 Tax=Xylocopilactobacillus apicola TaxID=2932184 RepID=A0AAU9D336_9LACO|nr:hypothetical protein XA3_06200 [Xylocopilactobacillus apicola]
MTGSGSWNNTEKRNEIDLQWNAPANLSGGYHVERDLSASFTSAGEVGTNYGKRFKILNVAPRNAAVGKWFEGWMKMQNSAGTGPVDQGLFDITTVWLKDFNDNPGMLKNPDGTYKYDSIFFGASDWNSDNYDIRNQDLTDASSQATRAFGDTGRAVTFGHDTVEGAADNITPGSDMHVGPPFHPYFNRFASLLGLSVSPSYTEVGSDRLKIAVPGSLTQQPYFLDPTKIYNVSPSHTCCSYYVYNSGATRWIKYDEATLPTNYWRPGDSFVTYLRDGAGNVIADDNWYLVSKNNYAQIQTGHTTGQCTPQEAEIIFNMIYYTSSLNTSTTGKDINAKDTTAPEVPKMTGVSCAENDVNLTLSFDASDLATDYYYRARADTSAGDAYSDIIKIPSLSGIQGYVYSIDSNPTGTPNITRDPATNKVTNINLTPTTGTSAKLYLERTANYDKYLHIVSVDNANNVSSAKTIKLLDYFWWNVDSNNVLTIYPHELNASADLEPFPNPNNPYYRDWPWYPYQGQITKAVLKPGVTARNSLGGLFQWMPLMTTIEGLERLDTSEVTDMYRMFVDCKSLTNLNVTNFDTSSVTNMSSMFNGCRSLTDIDVTHFNTSNVYSMQGMFENCSSLTSLDITNFDTSKVEYMFGVFSGCSSLTSLDLTHFNTSSAKYMGSLFSGCTSLRSLDLTGFDTRKAENMYYMFDGCEQLTDVDVTSFDTSSVTNMIYMFKGCKSLTSLDLSSFDLTNVTNTSDGYGRINHGYHEMLKDTDKLWKLTLGPNTKFPDVTVDGLEVSVNLKDPTPGKPINDLAKPVPPNSQYFATDAQWREASTDDFLHEPDGEAKTADEIMSESATANRKRTYVWDQRGRVLLEAPTAIDFGTHRGSVRSHNYKSEDHKFKVTDNRNSRKNKKWRIEAAMTKPLTKGTKRITGNPLHHKNGSGVETNLTPVAVQLAEKVIPGVIYEDTWEEPWNMLFKTTANEIPEAGSYSGEVTYTLLDSTP